MLVLKLPDRESQKLGVPAALLYFVDVNRRVIASAECKRRATHNQLQHVRSVGRERYLIAQRSARNDKRRRWTYPDAIHSNLYIAQQRCDGCSQRVGHPVNAVRIDHECRVVILADRCSDNKWRLAKRYSAANANSNAAAVVVEQDCRQAPSRSCRSRGSGRAG